MTNEEARDKLIEIKAMLTMLVQATYGLDAEVSDCFDIAIKKLEKPATDENIKKYLADRPCDVCVFHKEEGCSKWNCVFEE